MHKSAQRIRGKFNRGDDLKSLQDELDESQFDGITHDDEATVLLLKKKGYTADQIQEFLVSQDPKRQPE